MDTAVWQVEEVVKGAFGHLDIVCARCHGKAVLLLRVDVLALACAVELSFCKIADVLTIIRFMEEWRRSRGGSYLLVGNRTYCKLFRKILPGTVCYEGSKCIIDASWGALD